MISLCRSATFSDSKQIGLNIIPFQDLPFALLG